MDAVRIEHAPGRFVARLDGTEAVRRGDVLDIQSTYTPPEQRGRTSRPCSRGRRSSGADVLVHAPLPEAPSGVGPARA